ncbi:translation initiation factor IF-2-like [Vulpes lagopus]|uniref:translation initiation factor IF-2-like n=1 Tax=Vulpes lagopus TaxID=494514 RepID=UPI001BC96C7D|nr:translation initiation factor IF-2-like [Vulpes lagopus]
MRAAEAPLPTPRLGMGAPGPRRHPSPLPPRDGGGRGPAAPPPLTSQDPRVGGYEGLHAEPLQLTAPRPWPMPRPPGPGLRAELGGRGTADAARGAGLGARRSPSSSRERAVGGGHCARAPGARRFITSQRAARRGLGGAGRSTPAPRPRGPGARAPGLLPARSAAAPRRPRGSWAPTPSTCGRTSASAVLCCQMPFATGPEKINLFMPG